LAEYSLAPVDASPALLLQGEYERVLVVGDLHIGWEVTLAQQGIHVPSQTSKLADRLIDIIRKSSPTRIVFLGDVKHTVVGAQLEEWRDVPEFFEKIVPFVSDIQIIQGNHDGNIEPMTPPQVKILPPSGIALWGRYGLFHGHAWPAPELLGCESLIQGHLHPVVAFTDALGYRITRPVWVRAPCDGARLARVIMRESKRRRIKGIGDKSQRTLRGRVEGLPLPFRSALQRFSRWSPYQYEGSFWNKVGEDRQLRASTQGKNSRHE